MNAPAAARCDDEPALDRWFQALRQREFAHLDAQGLAYLDYTGAALPSATQIAAHDRLLRGQVLGNPHSDHGPSRASADAIARARAAVLAFLDADADEYAVVFTANASAAIKLVAESFPFARRSRLWLSADNHNSVNGLREYARAAGGRLQTLPLGPDLRLCAPARFAAPRGTGPSLFALPAQSNFSGVQHPLAWIAAAQAHGCSVLLDAAAYVPSNALSLRRVRPEFVVLSFYKLFGFPTGVGALVARRDALARLRRPWFAGGTVDWVSVQHRRHQLRPTVEAFEDGTPDYYGIASLAAGFELLAAISMPRVTARVQQLTRALLAALRALRHADGAPLIRCYGPADDVDRGGTVALNLLDRDGAVVPYELVERHASCRGVAVRGGCFCNPGAAEAAFGFPAESLRCLQTATGADFSPRRFADCLGGDVPVGAIRVSVGIATSMADVHRAVEVLAECAAAPRGRARRPAARRSLRHSG